jgi:hypothetical protein
MKRIAMMVVVASSLTGLSAASACGGLFCSSGGPPAPVDQTAERTVCDVDEKGIRALVEINYAGTADEFAWVVPVKGVPEVAEGDPSIFNQVEQQTTLSTQLPPQQPCDFGGGSSSSGFGCSSDAASPATFGSGDSRTEVVTVLAHDYAGDFEFHMVGATGAAVLVGWLQDNGYNVSDNMTPVMEPYLGSEMSR